MSKVRNTNWALSAQLIIWMFGLLPKVEKFKEEFDLKKFLEEYPDVDTILDTLVATDNLAIESFTAALVMVYDPSEDDFEFILGCIEAFQDYAPPRITANAKKPAKDKAGDTEISGTKAIGLVKRAEGRKDFVEKCGGVKEALQVLETARDKAGSVSKLAEMVGKNLATLNSWYVAFKNPVKPAVNKKDKKKKKGKKRQPDKPKQSSPSKTAAGDDKKLTHSKALELLRKDTTPSGLIALCEGNVAMAVQVFEVARDEFGSIAKLAAELGKATPTINSSYSRLKKMAESGGDGRSKSTKDTTKGKSKKSAVSSGDSNGSRVWSDLIDNDSVDTEAVEAYSKHGKAAQFRKFWVKGGKTPAGCQKIMAETVLSSKNNADAARILSGILDITVKAVTFKKWAKLLGVKLEFRGGTASIDSDEDVLIEIGNINSKSGKIRQELGASTNSAKARLIAAGSVAELTNQLQENIDSVIINRALVEMVLRKDYHLKPGQVLKGSTSTAKQTGGQAPRDIGPTKKSKATGIEAELKEFELSDAVREGLLKMADSRQADTLKDLFNDIIETLPESGEEMRELGIISDIGNAGMEIMKLKRKLNLLAS